MKFIDGTPVDQEYLDKLHKLVHGAAKATETCSEDELEEYAAKLNSAQTPKNDDSKKQRNLCVDGHEFRDSESNWMGDGKFSPFAVFDIDAQKNLQPYYATRKQAENAMNKILATGHHAPKMLANGPANAGDTVMHSEFGNVVLQFSKDRDWHYLRYGYAGFGTDLENLKTMEVSIPSAEHQDSGSLKDQPPSRDIVRTLPNFNSESSLPRDKVAEILLANDEICNGSKIGYYDSLTAIAEKVSGSKNWSIGEVFVHARSPDDFVIMKQIAPDSCEMLTMTKKGIHDVLTAYRFKPHVLADMLDKYMQESNGMGAQTPKRKPKSPSLGM